jgi:hypothetical protein
MEKLRKVISLSQASKISGYHSDYLSALIRKGEMQGEKIGGNWFTTEEELNNYIFKQKIRHQKFAVWDFLSKKRTQNIFVTSGIIFLGIVLIIIYFYGKYSHATFEEGKKTLSPDAEGIEYKN